VAAVLAVCCVRCGPCRLLCLGGVPCGGKHIIIIGIDRYSSVCLYVYIDDASDGRERNVALLEVGADS